MSKKTMRNLLSTVQNSKFETIIKTYLVKMTTSAQQRQVFAKKFQSFDKDKSGFIDKIQLMSAYKQIYGHQMQEDVDLSLIMETIDINNSGVIDFSEFMAAISRVQTLFTRERLQKAFQFIESDGTGEIQIGELIKLLNNELQKGAKSQQDEQIGQILKNFDRDGDKTISRKQFIQFFLKLSSINRRRTTIMPQEVPFT